MKYLISACLLGQAVRYDGGHCLVHELQQLLATGQAVAFCPEVAGGLSTPRLPAEIVAGHGQAVLAGQAKVLDSMGQDVTAAFILGAERCLALALQHQVTHVVLKANSPSCGSTHIYNGHFNGQKIEGQGVTAALLSQHGFQVMSEQEFLQQLA
ncbi:DUF523 domain-containing protein [Acinetobacter rudis]|uniref:DUF523 domain-containing protein n=1 Tax=Acinetobacter rudis TaxID=632955 RepID=A0AAW8J2W8_9GAMM|nr:DUF523 domain-containing protein [Acinetobacter rudis]MDQ8934347.1 DUF523 domain-containing protein [Acinetobacter rudis]MDQ8952531.1 DUF523 domain-containing protein [Acinetobacter rudis]MDQ9016345.1 DUF523 domain-containing protein [Acinetobacter rudis]